MNSADELLGKAISGEQKAVVELFLRYRPQLKRMVQLKMQPKLRKRLDESDVLQESFLELVRRLPDYGKAPHIPFFAWLRLLVSQRLYHLQRTHFGAEKRAIYREVDFVSHLAKDASVFNLANQLADQFTSVDRNLIKEEVQRKLVSALQEMDTNDREILEMRHFEELSTLEIGEVLGLTRSGVLKRYTRALRRLRDTVFGDPDFQVE